MESEWMQKNMTRYTRGTRDKKNFKAMLMLSIQFDTICRQPADSRSELVKQLLFQSPGPLHRDWRQEAREFLLWLDRKMTSSCTATSSSARKSRKSTTNSTSYHSKKFSYKDSITRHVSLLLLACFKLQIDSISFQTRATAVWFGRLRSHSRNMPRPALRNRSGWRTSTSTSRTYCGKVLQKHSIHDADPPPPLPKQFLSPSGSKPQRVCIDCYDLLSSMNNQQVSEAA